MKSLAKKTSNFLNSTHEGAETFEVVVIVAILVILILAAFAILQPALDTKFRTISEDINAAGEHWRP